MLLYIYKVKGSIIIIIFTNGSLSGLTSNYYLDLVPVFCNSTTSYCWLHIVLVWHHDPDAVMQRLVMQHVVVWLLFHECTHKPDSVQSMQLCGLKSLLAVEVSVSNY